MIWIHCPLQNDRLEAALRQKEEENSRLRLQHGTEMTQIMEELRELRANYELKMKEYQELMDVKVQLDQEIATYRALLQEEETRCVCLSVCLSVRMHVFIFGLGIGWNCALRHN